MRKTYCYVLLLTIGLLTVACEQGESAAERSALAFAEAFYNYDLRQAQQYVTPESKKWIQLIASNITERDLEFIGQQRAKVEITDSKKLNDTLQRVKMQVNNYAELGNIGQDAHPSDIVIELELIKRNGKWLVKMADLPRNEKRNHD